MVLLSGLDRHLKLWHVAVINIAALVWFIGLTLAIRFALPGVALFRCPIGFCAGGYSPEELYSIFDEIGEEGRAFLFGTLLRADLVLPALLALALALDIIWFSRPGARVSVQLHPAARLAMLAVPLLYAVVDYVENSAIADVLRLYPNIDDVMAEKTSALTAAKSQLVATSIGIVAALATAAWGLAHRSDTQSPPDQ